MQVTGIKRQLQRTDRYAIFIDGEYRFSLGSQALLESKLILDQSLDEAQLEQLTQLAAADDLYDRTLHYLAQRMHSTWEIRQYLSRKDASPILIEQILNKLSNMRLLDDEAFARAFIADRLRLRPTSSRMLTFELRKKHVTDEIIRKVLEEEKEEGGQSVEQAALRSIIARKRKQSKYRDKLKMMQYLARQGFAYDDVKTALRDYDSDS